MGKSQTFPTSRKRPKLGMRKFFTHNYIYNGPNRLQARTFGNLQAQDYQTSRSNFLDSQAGFCTGFPFEARTSVNKNKKSSSIIHNSNGSRYLKKRKELKLCNKCWRKITIQLAEIVFLQTDEVQDWWSDNRTVGS